MIRIKRLLATVLVIIALPLHGVAGVIGVEPAGAFSDPGVTEQSAIDGAGSTAAGHRAKRVAALDVAPQAATVDGPAVVTHAAGAARLPCAGGHVTGDGAPCADLNPHSAPGGACTPGCGVAGVPTQVALHLSATASDAPPVHVMPLHLGDPPPSPERPPRRPSF